jgi:hypothetical protein
MKKPVGKGLFDHAGCIFPFGICCDFLRRIGANVKGCTGRMLLLCEYIAGARFTGIGRMKGAVRDGRGPIGGRDAFC